VTNVTNWDAGDPKVPAGFETWGQAISADVDAVDAELALKADLVDGKVPAAQLPDDLVTTLHQLDDRSWSAAVPARGPSDQRIEVIGWDDPLDPTFGPVNGAANMTNLDRWLNPADRGIAAPWL